MNIIPLVFLLLTYYQLENKVINVPFWISTSSLLMNPEVPDVLLMAFHQLSSSKFDTSNISPRENESSLEPGRPLTVLSPFTFNLKFSP